VPREIAASVPSPYRILNPAPSLSVEVTNPGVECNTEWPSRHRGL
jgi:hypothetical protein